MSAPSIIAVLQARMGSTRFPNKVMKEILGRPMIELLLERLSKSKNIDKIIVAIPSDPQNTLLAEHLMKLNYEVYKGSENDVLDRYYQAVKKYMPDIIVRITGDCPLIDPVLVDAIIDKHKSGSADYTSNTLTPTYPDGLDTEVFSFASLENANENAEKQEDREHVTPFIKTQPVFNVENYANKEDLSAERWTVDEAEDFEVIKKVFEYFHPRIDFSWKEIYELSKKHPEFFQMNRHLIRNEGSKMGTGQKLWKRAKNVIPGGNMLLSKRAEMFLPDLWPAFYSKAKGCKIWDLDGKEYIDMSIMGIGTNSLGYGHPEVDEAVLKTVNAGNMSTLNCPEEVYLAEKLIEMHPWADMARFARSGGEANAIAIRIARAASGKDKVAICGYHGWHDWYLAANLGDENLGGHLLPGLEPNGVPEHLRGTVFPFTYNHFDELELLVNTHDIGVIKMEVLRNHGPEDNFLQKIRKLATERGIILIFDECTSGFRQTFGGLHKLYQVEPDMAMFGKALGNGYAITAVIGKREIMQAAQTTFISSTFWTERIGPTAALKTLEVMERKKSWEIITEKGKKISDGWLRLAEKNELSISIAGLPALISFNFNSPDTLKYKTFITQEMLKKGYLASNSVYACTEHTEEILDSYFEALSTIFPVIKECELGRDISKLLDGPVCHAGFKRLN
jgi:glutamate-1-semialdehyde 2,1-aminomutase